MYKMEFSQLLLVQVLLQLKRTFMVLPTSALKAFQIIEIKDRVSYRSEMILIREIKMEGHWLLPTVVVLMSSKKLTVDKFLIKEIQTLVITTKST
tara:strand:+ start:162 stop:446 length:285 start_codon:yes stop_codon:yes gene_type:complete